MDKDEFSFCIVMPDLRVRQSICDGGIWHPEFKNTPWILGQARNDNNGIRGTTLVRYTSPQPSPT
jgi:hypothetical protein